MGDFFQGSRSINLNALVVPLVFSQRMSTSMWAMRLCTHTERRSATLDELVGVRDAFFERR